MYESARPLGLELGGPSTDVRRLDRSHRHSVEVLLDELQITSACRTVDLRRVR
jgi:hypothetical protein